MYSSCARLRICLLSRCCLRHTLGQSVGSPCPQVNVVYARSGYGELPSAGCSAQTFTEAHCVNSPTAFTLSLLRCRHFVLVRGVAFIVEAIVYRGSHAASPGTSQRVTLPGGCSTEAWGHVEEDSSSTGLPETSSVCRSACSASSLPYGPFSGQVRYQLL